MADFFTSALGGFRAGRQLRNEGARYDAVREKYGDIAGGDVETGVAVQQNDRQQQEFEAERQMRSAQGALNAYKIGVQKYGDTPEKRAMIFDKIAGGLAAAGADTDSLGQIRGALVEQPELADVLIEGLRDPTKARTIGVPQAAIDPETGEAYFMDSSGARVGTGQPASVLLRQEGYRQGAERIGLGRDTLEQRQYENQPDTIQAQSAAKAEGTATGEIAAALPRIDEITDSAITRVGELTAHPAFDAIWGLPNLARLETGGFGAAGVVPGTPAADALALLNRTIGDVQTAAYESLRGGGQITEAERESIARGIANLERAQSPQAAMKALYDLSSTLDRRRNAAHLAAERGRSGVSNAAPKPAAPAPAAPAKQPTNSLRKAGETTDQLLNRLGL